MAEAIPVISVASSHSSDPAHYHTSADLAEAYIKNHTGSSLSESDRQWIRARFNGTTNIKSYLSVPIEKAFTRMPRTEYNDHVFNLMLSLGKSAAEQVLSNAMSQYNIDRSSITHLFFGTATAYNRAPSLDVELCLALGLAPTVRRTHVFGQGCLTGFNLITRCAEIAQANPNNRVLLIVCDIRSGLGHLQPEHDANVKNGKGRAFHDGDVIVCSLFRDGGGAALFGNLPKPSTVVPAPQSQSLLTVLDGISYLVPGSLEHTKLVEHDDGSQRLHLGLDLPEILQKHLASVLSPVLKQYDVSVGRSMFAVHTGGPSVIKAVKKALGLRDEQLAASWYIMRHRGNLSGASNLAVLEYTALILQNKLTQSDVGDDAHIIIPTNVSKYTHVIGISLGPGVGLEIALFKVNNVSEPPVSERRLSAVCRGYAEEFEDSYELEGKLGSREMYRATNAIDRVC